HGHKRLRAPAHPPVHARLALAAAGAEPLRARARARLRSRPARPGALPRALRQALRTRARHALVPCGADRHRLRTDSGRRARTGLVCRGRSAPRGRSGTLRAVSGSSRGRSPGRRALEREDRRARRPRPAPPPDDDQGVRPVRQALRITGAVLLGAGVLGLGWALLVWQWQDPVTALYTTYQQHRLTVSYDRAFATYRVPFVPVDVNHKTDLEAEQLLIAREARKYRLTLRRGQAL